VFYPGINAAVEVSIGDVAQGIAFGGNIVGKPAPTDKKNVVNNLAPGGFESVEQFDRRLFAKRAL